MQFVRDQLRKLEGVVAKRMFGGHGLYARGHFFGIVSHGSLYFKTDDTTRAEYERRGMQAFKPREKQTLRRYFEVPADVLESPAELVEWAARAVACAVADSVAKS